jgi:hypothetical protein
LKTRTKSKQVNEPSTKQPEDYNSPIRSKDEIIQLEEEYETGTEIPCCITDCHQPHKRGRYALVTGGIISRVGNVCARRLLGDENFTFMEREFEHRRQRTLRERFISSPAFDPEAALAALKPWNARIRDIEALEQSMALWDTMRSYPNLREIKKALNENDGVIDFYDWDTDQGRAIRLRGAQFLIDGWKTHFTQGKIALQRSIRLWRSQDLSDEDLQNIVRNVSKASSLFRIVADVIDDFDHFCRSQNTQDLFRNIYPQLQLPVSIGPIDRSAIDYLSQN